jgi:hypothetical protein
MPRKSKTQPIATTAPGQPYGIASDQQAAMKTLPLPNSVIKASLSDPTSTNVPTPPIPLPQDGMFGSPITMGQGMESAQPDQKSMLEAALNTAPPLGNAFSDAPRFAGDQTLMPSMAPAAPKSAIANILNMIAESHGNDPALIAIAANAARKGY